jgi:hypothetical protein
VSEQKDKDTESRDRARRDRERQRKEKAQREQQEQQHKRQQEIGIEPSPPPYEVPETPLERLGPGFAYMFGVVGAAFLLNLLVMVLIAGGNGG